MRNRLSMAVSTDLNFNLQLSAIICSFALQIENPI